ncbi:MAG TPA: PAS domain-containing hybrid sensor histidine kinase/response regulator [Myxococcales bacterium]|nr:PAS domain-containing hybrid sensor histidine kinase/response regulator [Myxococcales bacterium]
MSNSTDRINELTEEAVSLRARVKEIEDANGESGLLDQPLSGSAAGRNAILQCSLDCIVTIDSDGLIMEFNPAAEETFGHTCSEVLGKEMANLIVPPALRDAHEQGIQHYLASGEGPLLNKRIEITAIRSNGQEFPVELAITPFRIEGKEAFTAFIRDITDRKRAEEILRETERQLREAHKMEAVGKLAGGIAHDFNNLLTVVIGSSELLETTNDPVVINELASDIQAAAERAAQLTRQLLTFSRKQVTELGAVDLNDVVNASEETLRRLIPAEVELVLDLEPNLKAILGNLIQIDQVTMNLVVNSGNATEGAGQIRVVTKSIALSSSEVISPDMAPGDYILFEVQDTGSGMTQEVKSRIFEPFYTTANPGEGTGLGLATVYGIVLESGGFMHVESEVGIGTTFSIYFPGLDPPAAINESQTETWNFTGGAETVLVVEDEDSVRALVSRILKSEGYHVLEASNGPEAVSISELTYKRPIHLLISDILMPNTDGRDLAHQLSLSRPDLKVLLMSGFADNISTEGRTHDKPTAFIAKPFVPAELKNLVRNILDN